MAFKNHRHYLFHFQFPQLIQSLDIEVTSMVFEPFLHPNQINSEPSNRSMVPFVSIDGKTYNSRYLISLKIPVNLS